MNLNNYALFTLWSDEEYEKVLEETAKSSSSFVRSTAMTEAVFVSLNFELISDDDLFLLEIERIHNHLGIELEKTRSLRWHRAWLFNMKALTFHHITDGTYKTFLKGGIPALQDFDELEKFTENYKHRFASKKFGL